MHLERKKNNFGSISGKVPDDIPYYCVSLDVILLLTMNSL